MIRFTCPQCSHTIKVHEEAAGKTGSCNKCGEQIKVPASINTQQAKTEIIKTIVKALIVSKTPSVQSRPNKFIEAFKNQYNESLRLLDEETSKLIKSGANLSAIEKFNEQARNIFSIYGFLKNLYSSVFKSNNILEHFNSSKLTIKRIPLSFILETDSLDLSHLKLYQDELQGNFKHCVDEDNEFKSVASHMYFQECIASKLLDEAGYNKKHWYLKDLVINEMEFMFDYLLEFVEEEYSPINEESADNEDEKITDRYVSKITSLAVWKRDLGKCVQCGSQEKLEYDHVIPVSKGGSNTERNIQILCEKCNRMKSNSIA